MAKYHMVKKKIKDWIYIHLKSRLKPFKDSSSYWKERYASGKNSGSGSYEQLAVFKAEFINDFVRQHDIKSVIELGCGDGNQLKLASYPFYQGFDISEDAIAMCRTLFKDDAHKIFDTMDQLQGQQAQLVLSLDVLYHLVEDAVYEKYMQQLFDASTAYVIIYSSNTEEQHRLQAPHVRHRRFSSWIDAFRPEWKLLLHQPNAYPYEGDEARGSLADFYVYQK